MRILVYVEVIHRTVMTFEKHDVTTTVGSRNIWPAIARRIDHHPEEERFEDLRPEQLEERRAETIKGDFDHAPRVRNDHPLRPKRNHRRPGGARPQEELYFTTSPKPEDNSTLQGVKVESTPPEHATQFRKLGRLSARRDISSESAGVQVGLECGATSTFMSMQTAKRARLPLYKLTNSGHIMTAGGVQVEVQYYTRAYGRVGEFIFQHHFKVLKIAPDVVLALPWLRS